MILTKEMAERAKELINTSAFLAGNKTGVCRAIQLVSKFKIDLYDHGQSFWGAPEDDMGYRWPSTPEGDEKRRKFIDSLIGKDP